MINLSFVHTDLDCQKWASTGPYVVRANVIIIRVNDTLIKSNETFALTGQNQRLLFALSSKLTIDATSCSELSCQRLKNVFVTTPLIQINCLHKFDTSVCCSYMLL